MEKSKAYVAMELEVLRQYLKTQEEEARKVELRRWIEAEAFAKRVIDPTSLTEIKFK